MASEERKSSWRPFDQFPSGVCLISMDDSERILYANRELLFMYSSKDQESFLRDVRSYRGMVQPHEYVPLSEIYERRLPGENYSFFTILINSSSHDFRRLEGILGTYEDESLGKVWILSFINSPSRGEVLEQDSLTGFMGRHTFYEMVRKTALEDMKNGVFGRLLPAYVNLTNFKMYNSRRGVKAGDALIRKMAELLRKYFPGSLIAHLAGDNFILLAPKGDIESSFRHLAGELEKLADDRSIALKVGIMTDKLEGTLSLQLVRGAFDQARIACDSIKGDSSRLLAVYDKTMGQKLADRTYVLRNFDEALEKGYIKVYYQPVVRTLTGKVCSMEALARWEDPEKGLLTPAIFIPVLEEARLIPRLDSYMIEEAAKLCALLRRNRRPVIPVSVNLSRVDFDVMKPFQFVESIVSKYEIPRSALRLEVTESALTVDSGRLKEELAKFRKAGYQCWLDDFGSGYSSLNVLQNFSFDELKMDMAFQRQSGRKSREIMRSIVTMAKALGIHTLAEGVETKEQADFLKSIGCEKIQGYYYSRPLPFEDLSRHLEARSLEVETRQEEDIMEKLGLVDVLTDLPVSLFLDDGKNSKILLENEALRRTMESIIPGRPSPEGDLLTVKDAPAMERYRSLVKRAVDSGRKESMIYVDHGQYINCQVQIIAGRGGLYAGRCEINNLNALENIKKENRGKDRALRNLAMIYDGLYLFHHSENQVEILESRQPFFHQDQSISWDEWIQRIQYIHAEDRNRFEAFMNPRYLFQRAEKAENSVVTGIFRVRGGEGYSWEEVNALMLGREEKEDILFCFKRTSLSMVDNRNEILSLYATSRGYTFSLQNVGKWESKGRILEVLQKSEDIMFFWKDRQRRFLGASRAFLDCYGISDERNLIGKTDEDMGWHVDDRDCKDIETKVLEEGFISRRARGECIIRGKIHHIESTRFPVYQGNEIVGLLGYFRDLDHVEQREETDKKLGFVDQETGLLSFRGMIMTGMAYTENYEKQGEDFLGLLIHIPELHETLKMQADTFRKDLLHQVVSAILSFFPLKETLSYLGEGRFLIFVKVRQADYYQIRTRLLDMANHIHHIHEVDGQPVTLYLHYAMAHGSEAEGLDEFLRILFQRLHVAEKERWSQSMYTGDRVNFDREAFDHADEAVAISDFDNYDLLYLNRESLKNLGLPASYPYRGQKCYALLHGNDKPCDDCPKDLLRRGRFFSSFIHNRKIGKDYLARHILVPFEGRKCQFITALDLGKYVEKENKKNDFLYKEAAVNDAIEAGMKEGDPSKGIMQMLSCVGKILEAEKACIFEEMPDGTVRNTYEWCREGIPSTKAMLQHVPKEDVRYIYDSFGPDQIAIVEDVPAVLKKYGRRAAHMPGLESLISGHLIMAGQSLGYTEIVNPSASILEEASPLLATLTRFFSIMMRNRNTMHQLKDWSYEDQLTGVKNRRAFLKFIRSLRKGSTWTFFFGDLNGLKTMNDEKGHEKGDEALRQAARVLSEPAGPSCVFRMGGDEFILALENGSPEKAEALKKELKQNFARHGISMALGWAIRQAPVKDIDALITEADRNMYKDKKHPRK